ncbi:MAG TPA: hypothetical protein VGY31_13610 [Terriglobia bacterium]|nr:hypothetical protein [Terriglobia bacterium]
MDTGVGVPLMVFAAVVIIFALLHFVRLHDFEAESHRRIHYLEMEHGEMMQRLRNELSATQAQNPGRGGNARQS